MNANTKTPAVLADLIDRLAEDKATKLRTMAKATVVFCTVPEWMRKEEARAYFGLPTNQLIDLAIKGKVCAKKLDAGLRASAVVFRTTDIREAIEHLPDYAEWLKSRPDLREEGRGKREEAKGKNQAKGKRK